MKRLPLLILAFSCVSSTSFAITVTVASPAQNSYFSAPLHLLASAQSQNPITGWVAYSDSVIVYKGPATANIDAWFPITLGTHQLVVRAWDSQGAYASQTVQINVVSDGLPTPLVLGVRHERRQIAPSSNGAHRWNVFSTFPRCRWHVADCSVT